MSNKCNGCGRCCEEFDYILREEDLINWFFDLERDNTDILEKVTIDAMDADDEYNLMSGVSFCLLKYDLGEPFPLVIDMSMRRYRGDMENAFDGWGKCWFFDGKNKKCKIQEVKPQICRQFFCKSGEGTDEELFRTAVYPELPYPHKISKAGEEAKKRPPSKRYFNLRV